MVKKRTADMLERDGRYNGSSLFERYLPKQETCKLEKVFASFDGRIIYKLINNIVVFEFEVGSTITIFADSRKVAHTTVEIIQERNNMAFKHAVCMGGSITRCQLEVTDVTKAHSHRYPIIFLRSILIIHCNILLKV